MREGLLLEDDVELCQYTLVPLDQQLGVLSNLLSGNGSACVSVLCRHLVKVLLLSVALTGTDLKSIQFVEVDLSSVRPYFTYTSTSLLLLQLNFYPVAFQWPALSR